MSELFTRTGFSFLFILSFLFTNNYETIAEDVFFSGDEKIEKTTQANSDVLSMFDDETKYAVIAKNSNGQNLPNIRAILSNGTTEDTLLTDGWGTALFTNGVISDVDEPNVQGVRAVAGAKRSNGQAHFKGYFPNAQGTVTITGYNIVGEEAFRYETTTQQGYIDARVPLHQLASGNYPYSISTEEGVSVTGMINTTGPIRAQELDAYHNLEKMIREQAHTIEPLEHTLDKSMTFTLRLESTTKEENGTDEDSPPIRAYETTVTIDEGVFTQEIHHPELFPNAQTFYVTARDHISGELLPETTIELTINGEPQYSGTANEQGVLELNDVDGSLAYGLRIRAPNDDYYGVQNAGFHIKQPRTEEEVVEHLEVYLWKKELPIPGAAPDEQQTITPSLYEIVEMAPGLRNLQRALGTEVHSLQISDAEEENAREYYAHIDSTIFGGEWGVQLKINEPYAADATHAGHFSLDKMEEYGYNVITNGGSNAEYWPSDLIEIGRAQPRKYTVEGRAYISGFAGNLDDATHAKEIVFRLGDHGDVGGRPSVGNAVANTPTEKDRALLYSYFKHGRRTLTSNRVIYYSEGHLTE